MNWSHPQINVLLTLLTLGLRDHRSFRRRRFNTSLRRISVALLALIVLNGCAPPRPAPVVSREVGHQREQVSSSELYTVKRGDTIYSIAWRYGLDYREFAQWNNIRSPYNIHPGRRLWVKNRASSAIAQREPVNIIPAYESKVQPAVVPKASSEPKKSIVSQNEPNYSLKLHWQWPTNGKVKVGFKKGDHTRKGVVLTGQLGQDIKAAEAGTVVYSGSGLIGYGKLLIIKHNKNYLSAYGHNKSLLVKEGDQVNKGTHIADMGTNGSGDVALHFEIRRNGIPVDPMPLLPRKL